jgi:hypothetical protein
MTPEPAALCVGFLGPLRAMNEIVYPRMTGDIKMTAGFTVR